MAFAWWRINSWFSFEPELNRIVNIANERIVVTGANGWLGREVIYRLVRNNPEVSLLALGRSSNVLQLPKCRPVKVHEWKTTEIDRWGPTALIHLAALTKERLLGMSAPAYIAENRHLLESALDIVNLDTIRSVVIASSGAAITQLDHPYGVHKALEEVKFQEAASQRDVAMVIARIWSVSGRFCTKPEHFLFFDLIRQAISKGESIRIRAGHPVRRKYVDGGEFLEICFRAASSGHSGTIDSTGFEVEATELAEIIQSELKTKKTIRREVSSERADSYLAKSMEMMLWAETTGVEISSLPIQIVRSLDAVKSSLKSEDSI